MGIAPQRGGGGRARSRWPPIALACTATATAASATTPTLSLAPSSGEVGTAISAAGRGFTEGGVELFVGAVDPGRILATTAVDRTGSFTVAFTIPSIHAGDHTVIVCVAA